MSIIFNKRITLFPWLMPFDNVSCLQHRLKESGFHYRIILFIFKAISTTRRKNKNSLLQDESLSHPMPPEALFKNGRPMLLTVKWPLVTVTSSRRFLSFASSASVSMAPSYMYFKDVV